MEQGYEEVKDENEEESPARKIWVGIGWYPNTNFYGVDTKLLFGNHFRLQSTSQQGGDDVTIKKNWTSSFKKHIKPTHKILEVNIYRVDTEYDCQVYEKLWIITGKEVGRQLKIDKMDFLGATTINQIIPIND